MRTGRVAGLVPLLAIVGCGHAPKATLVPPLTEAEFARLTPPELKPRRMDVSPRDNGYLLLLALMPPRIKPLDLRKLDPTPLESFNAEQVETALRPLRLALSALERSLRAPHWQAPRKRGMMTRFPEFAWIKNLARALTLRAHLRLQRGDADGAADDLIATRRLGRRMRQSESILIGWVVGVSIETIATRSAQSLAWHPKMTRPAVARLAREWSAEDPIGETYAETIRCEYADMIGYELAFHLAGPGVDERSETGLQEVDAVIARMLVGHPRPFDRADSLRRAAEVLVPVVEDAERPWQPQRAPYISADLLGGLNLDGDRILVLPKLSPAEQDALAKRLHRLDNPYGRLLLSMSLPSFDHRYLPYRLVAQTRATGLVMATRLWAFDHGGALPPTLPPQPDPFGKGPMRYDPARRVVWSVGPDGKDDGGLDRPGDLKGRDFVWPVDGRFPSK